MSAKPVRPPGWKTPSGYENGLVVPAGARLCFVAGQVAWDADQRLVGRGDFPRQFRQALTNVLAVVEAAGGRPEHLCNLTIYVTDKELYSTHLRTLGAIWRELVGRSYPPMALLEVAGLLEDGALVELQAVAALPV